MPSEHALLSALLGVRRRHCENDVPAGDRQVWMRLARATPKRRHGHLGERDEVALGRVEHVGDAAAVAVARERQPAFDAMTLGLDADAFALVVHALLTRVRALVHRGHHLRTVYVRATAVRRPVRPAATITTSAVNALR